MPPSRKAFYERAKVYSTAPRRKVVPKRKAAALVVPGYTRTGGFYRYSKGQGKSPELKFFDTDLDFAFDTTGEVPATGQLVLIPQGDTESTRDGRQCTIKSVQIRGTVSFVPAAAATAATVAYMYLVLDKQCNGGAAAITDVFTTNNMTRNHVNLANSDRFRILKKWVMTFNSPAGVTTAYNNVIKPIEFYKSCNVPLNFSSTTGAITEIRSNNIFLCAGAIGSDDAVGMAGNCRVRFTG